MTAVRLALVLALVSTGVRAQQGGNTLPLDCKTTNESCSTHTDCHSERWGDKGRCNIGKSLCCDLSGDGGLITDACPGPAPGKDLYEQCSALTACSETDGCADKQACCLAGTCGKKCLPDLTTCTDTTVILTTVIANSDCIEDFTELIGTDVDFQTYCSSLFGGLACVAKKLVPGPFSALCLERMQRVVAANPNIIMDEIKKYGQLMGLTIDIDPSTVNQTAKCKDVLGKEDDDDDSKDKDEEKGPDLSSSCPSISRQGGLCPNECSQDSDCTKDNFVCCTAGRPNCRICVPDMSQCSDEDRVFDQSAVQTCLTPKLASLMSQDNRDGFCSDIWDVLNCSAHQIVDRQYGKMCLERIAHFMKASPMGVLMKLQKMVPNLDITPFAKYGKDLVSECKESPLFEMAKRPAVPGGVSKCVDMDMVLEKAGECGRVTNSNPTNAACRALKDLTQCIADKLIGDDDDHEKNKCRGQIYKFIHDNKEELINTFGSLDPVKCQARQAVCGNDLEPLDNVNCADDDCPADYTCKAGFCCPKVKEGWCPAQEKGGPAMCANKCQRDSQCDDDEKCCYSKACRYKTCIQKETKNKSQCDTEYEKGRKLLERQGICGNEKTLARLPLCQNSRFRPLQIDLWTGRGYCVNENGTKINGSDFSGNRDCTKVREGACPPVPAACTNGSDVENICKDDDTKCNDDEKCCLQFVDNSVCAKVCTKKLQAPETVEDDCQDRKCCPLTLCQDKKCPKDKTAKCRINSCGGCTAEFYNLEGMVDCLENVSVCHRKRAEAQEENARRGKSDNQRLYAFLNSRNRTELAKEWLRKRYRDMDDAEYEMEEDDDMEQDEYGEWRDRKDKLPDDVSRESEEEDDEEDSALKKEYIFQRFCESFVKLGICKNGGECVLGKGESFFEFCKCKPGYYGLQCELTGTVQPQDTPCNRDKTRVESLKNILMNQEMVVENMVLQKLLAKVKLPYKMIPEYACDSATGNYEPIQTGSLLPKSRDMMSVEFCVDTSTGMRKKYTPVVFAMSGETPDCSLQVVPDPMSLPKRCLAPKMADCNVTTCQYFWNQKYGTCEKGNPSHGFTTLTQCYEQCGLPASCDDDDDDDCETSLGPVPCRMYTDNVTVIDGCDYKTQFCHVEETTNSTIGTCMDFQPYCLEEPDSGFGDKEIGAYYFNAEARKCEKFVYKGYGGNKNRFYSLPQCQNECDARPYKFGDIVCPVPRKLALAKMDMMGSNTCDSDFDCYDNQVCCSDGKVRSCTDPVDVCMNARCSFEGACEEGICTCRNCSDTEQNEVCGSDGKTYQNECFLKRQSCLTMRNISIVSNGACSMCGEKYCESYEECENSVCVSKCPDTCTAQFDPVCGKGIRSGVLRTFSNACVMSRMACVLREKFVNVSDGCCKSDGMDGSCLLPTCTMEYAPICAYEKTNNNVDRLETFDNPCLFKVALMSGRNLRVLYPGKCMDKCGSSSCEARETCVNETCVCQKACTKEYMPICAHPLSDDTKKQTFSNLCVMRLEACQKSQTYVIFRHGPCKEPKPVYKCPEVMMDRVGSAEVTCDSNTNEGCDTMMGEMCCTIGAGNICIPKEALVRDESMKPGICPAFNSLNYDKSLCPEDNCMVDGDCEGDAKCCQNDVCGHKTCAEPEVKDETTICGENYRIVSKCSPNMTETGCPTGSTCNTVGADDSQVGVCCMPKNAEDADEELATSKLCQLLEMRGEQCKNGGTCVFNRQSAKVCQCPTGYFGPFCELTSPSEEPHTRCLAVREVLKGLNKTGLFSDELSFRNFLRDKGRTVTNDDEDDGGEDDDTDKDTNPFKNTVIEVLRMLGMNDLPQSIMEMCNSDGNFRQEQCIVSAMNGTRYCHCVNPQTGTPIPHGPRAPRREGLACNEFTTNKGLQNFCLTETPNMETCFETLTERFFFNPATMDCEMFTDYGCNEDIRNNFDTYETCKSTCGVGNSNRSPCFGASCPQGKVCRVKDGKKMCVDPKQKKGMFEPVCDDNGKFRPKQCNGDVCVCVNPVTGELIPDSIADGTKLQCQEEGGVIKPVRDEPKRCGANQLAMFCENGGDECNNCEEKQDSPNPNRLVDDNGVCLKCERCAAGQGGNKCPVPQKFCQQKCKQFPDAECSFNTCTCKEEYTANGKVVDCNKVQSLCNIQQHKAKQEKRAKMLRNGGDGDDEGEQEDSKDILCTDSGTFEAECTGDVCHCLNATDGTKIQSERYSRNNLNCEATQRKTKAKQLKYKMVLSKTKNWSSLSDSKKKAFEDQMRKKIEAKGLKIVSLQFRDGSIEADLVVEKCETDCVVVAEDADLQSVGNNLMAEVNEGTFELVVEGEVFTPTEAQITDVVTEEELNGPDTEETPEDDDNSTTIIIVVVVVVIVALVAIGLACYCYNKAHKSKDKDIPFSDIQGKSNPSYENP